MQEKAYTVYWIHEETHSNPFDEGYVGITANYEYRMKRYKQHGQKSHLLPYFEAGAQVRILAKNLCQYEALVLERKLRPARNIGWNKNSGGFMPPIPQSIQ